MKVLVFSDSHGSEQGMINAILAHADASAIVFLGDGERDFENALAECGIAPFGTKPMQIFQVRGNCDIYSMEPAVVTASFGGIRVLITHGSEQNVKAGYARLAQEARQSRCSVALFGHTHFACVEERDGVTLLNPGSIRGGKYAVLLINDEEVRTELLSV